MREVGSVRAQPGFVAGAYRLALPVDFDHAGGYHFGSHLGHLVRHFCVAFLALFSKGTQHW